MDMVYLLGALAGVGLLVALNLVLLGRVRQRVDAEAAAALLASEVPGFRAARCIISADGDGALLEDQAGTLFLVVAVGDKLASRKLSAAAGLRRAVRQGAALDLRFADPTFRHCRFVFADEEVAGEIAARLSA